MELEKDLPVLDEFGDIAAVPMPIVLGHDDEPFVGEITGEDHIIRGYN